MTARGLPVLAAALLASCGGDEAPLPEVTSYNVDRDRITVSGVSSGAMMATQFHLAHSDFVGGVAMIAGGPYYCAEASLQKGLGPCMKGGDMAMPSLLEYARAAAAAGSIDDLGNLADDPVWLFHGANDVAMHADATQAANEFYVAVADVQATLVDDIEAAHGFPTLDAGAACNEMAEPWLNACDYDAAGELLGILVGELAPRAEATGSVVELPQPGADDATMLPLALAYVPATCAAGESCGVHIAFHGCQQSSTYVGDAFARDAGYNEWAEANDLIVLYPQVDSSKIAPMNPMGCWDWWGYTDEHYATRSGPQVMVVKATLDLLAGETL